MSICYYGVNGGTGNPVITEDTRPLVYFRKNGEGGVLIRIGYSINIQNRLGSAAKDVSPEHGGVVLLGCTDCYTEKELHEMFWHLHHPTATGRGEWFNPGEDLLEFIKNHTAIPGEHADPKIIRNKKHRRNTKTVYPSNGRRRPDPGSAEDLRIQALRAKQQREKAELAKAEVEAKK